MSNVWTQFNAFPSPLINFCPQCVIKDLRKILMTKFPVYHFHLFMFSELEAKQYIFIQLTGFVLIHFILFLKGHLWHS